MYFQVCSNSTYPQYSGERYKASGPLFFLAFRVSIPRSTLASPHRVKPHRRRSFDNSDTMALSEVSIF